MTANCVGQTGGPVVGAKTDEGNFGGEQGFRAAQNGLIQFDAGGGDLGDNGDDGQIIPQMGWAQIVGLDPANSKDKALFGLHLALIKAKRGNPFRTAAFDKAQVIGVIDDAAQIGIFVIDADGVLMGHGLSLAAMGGLGKMRAIDVGLVRELLAAQFPEWAGLPLRPVEADGWDNRSFRLGAAMSVRLPSGADYADQVGKEAEWLPYLAQHLPVRVPEVLGLGQPGAGYPFPWSVRGWIAGQTASDAHMVDPVGLAAALGEFLTALHRVPSAGGPPPGAHNFMRGGDLVVYDAGARAGLGRIADRFDLAKGLSIWERALASQWQSAPVWVHGDVAWGNILLDDRGRLVAVIDFGCCAVGDPACDLIAAWRMFDAPARGVFREAVGLDEATWDRARGWALWKSAITLAEKPEDAESIRAMEALLAGA
jgi:aminoglycoside phosphotransferase (APT) family kinase protein